MYSPLMELSQLLAAARRILVFTGAGISTASGIPDFRGPQGVWTRRRPVYYQEFMTSEEARVEHWEFKLEGWPVISTAQPNNVHRAIVALERAGRILSVVTQNIDGLHASAGTSRSRLIELHGTNSLVECQTCGEISEPGPHFDYFQKHRKCPLCSCGGFLKTATISFGQNLDREVLGRASDAANRADLVVALGSTLSVHPAASIPQMAAQRGVPYVILNRGATEHDGQPFVTLRIEDAVENVFPAAVSKALRAVLPPS